MTELVEHPGHKAIVLKNATCAYCGRPFGPDLPPTKEHVIGRRFVPRGCFDGQWNLILQACERCNGDKAALEDDISAITMQPDLMGRHACEDPRLSSEAKRKARGSKSRRTGKAVADSDEEFKIAQKFGSMTMTFTFTAPAQIEDPRTFRLAHYLWRGFFYWITYNEQTRIGGFAPGDFCPVLAARKADWSNERLEWFTELCRGWAPRVHAIGADSFFKLLIRRDPTSEVWAWAMEWNRGVRIVGLTGDKKRIATLAETMPDLAFEMAHEAENEMLRYRTEIPLADENDVLFAWAGEIAKGE